ncbi:MAG: glycosyltransferase family 2 protein [Desulfobacterales bacterium]
MAESRFDPMMSASPPGNPSDSGAQRLAIVIPAFNHGGTVADVVRGALSWHLPVFVVDDGSTDGTSDRILSLGTPILLRHRKNLGKGTALLTGMAQAAEVADWAITLDADGQHDPRDIGVFLANLPRSRRAILVGRRSGMAAAPWSSRMGREFSNFWVRVAGGPRTTDSQSGFRAYPLPEVFHLDARARRFQFEVEVLVRACWAGIPTIEVPVGVSYGKSGPRISHFRPMVDFLRNSATFCRLITRRVFTPSLWSACPSLEGDWK